MRNVFAVAVAVLSLLLAGCVATTGDQAADRMQWWREARFGLFVHWGLYAIPAGSHGGHHDHGEWIRTTAEIPLAEYDKFREQWNPTGFDADAWAAAAARAGMKYIVLTSKHHDGFCLFDSAMTDFDVMATQHRRDIVRELAAACRRHGLRVGLYHSIMDWHHPDYLPRRPWERDRGTAGADFGRFTDYLFAQVTELLTNYGPIDVLWFDGEWEPTWTHELGLRLYEHCRRLQPDCLVNNRVDKGRQGMQGMTAEGGFAGDFGTPEQEVPAEGLPGVDWESCITMNRHWGWNAADTQWKSPTELIRMLIDVASKGGNLLLNIGPMGDGRFPPAANERLDAFAGWMATRGESIRGTTAAGLPELPFGRATLGPDPYRSMLYLHVFDRPADGRLHVPCIGNVVRGARVLGGDGAPLVVAQDGDVVTVKLSPTASNEHAEVIAVEMDGPPDILRTPRIEAASTIFLDRLTVRVHGDPRLDLRHTLDGSEPTHSSPVLRGNLQLTASAQLRVRPFRGERPVATTAAMDFTRVTPQPAVDAGGSRPGVQRRNWPHALAKLPDFAALPEVPPTVVPAPAASAGEHQTSRFTGLLTVPATAIYRFELRSDDGSRLNIGALQLDNDGLHAPTERTGVVALAAGAHPFVLDWFNGTGDVDLRLRMAPLGRPLAEVPAAAWSHR